jgi:hypothetical protein
MSHWLAQDGAAERASSGGFQQQVCFVLEPQWMVLVRVHRWE